MILPRDLGLFLSSREGVSLFTPGVWVYFFFSVVSRKVRDVDAMTGLTGATK